VRLFNKITTLPQLIILGLFILFASTPQVYAMAVEEQVTIVFTSGMAEILLDQGQGGVGQLQTLLKSLRSHNKNVVFLHGGDALSPSILSMNDRGAHMISILNDLNPAAMALSKSEFAHQEDNLSLRTFEAGFPLINCNIYDPLTHGTIEGIYPYHLLQVGDIKIGLLAVVDPEVISDYLTQRILAQNINTAVTRNTQILRDKGADIVILIADLNIDNFNANFSNPPVDIVLLDNLAGTLDFIQQGNSLFELRGHKGHAAIINLNIIKDDSQTRWTATGELVALNDSLLDPEVGKKITMYLGQLKDILHEKIGTTWTPLDTSRNAIRSGENAFANFTADALREYYQTDIALINGGAFRANKFYPAGSTLTSGDLLKELPFHNQALKLKVSGKMLQLILENGLSRINEQKGRFPHISGIKVEYIPNNPPMQRVTSIQLKGEPIAAEKFYTLATLDFLANGGDGYEVLINAERIVTIGKTRLLWEYVKNQIVNEETISPIIDGRLKALHP
jgi:2',3'-cyclic-nucleotide 2'-phosphodiesterase (5'-nucleotidase family)